MSRPEQITVFGGSGFIGRHLIRRLAKTGAVIRVPTRFQEKALLLKPMGDVGQIVPMTCGVRSDADVAYAVEGSQTVINLIGILYPKGRDTFQSVHVETAARIARLSKEVGVQRCVHMSALAADEDSPAAYGRSKEAGERAVRTFFPEAVIMRPSIVFGPEDNFFNMFARLATLSPVLPLIGGGHTRFQPVYVGDVAEAIARCLQKPEAAGQTYELGGPQVYTFRELLELMLRVMGRKRCLVNLPWALADIQAAILQVFPHPLLTRDQVKLLKADSVVSGPKARKLRDLGIAPTPVEGVLPSYLGRFHKD